MDNEISKHYNDYKEAKSRYPNEDIVGVTCIKCGEITYVPKRFVVELIDGTSAFIRCANCNHEINFLDYYNSIPESDKGNLDVLSQITKKEKTLDGYWDEEFHKVGTEREFNEVFQRYNLYKMLTPAMKEEWNYSGDASSETIFGVLSGVNVGMIYHSSPKDSFDFEKCYKLLKLNPEWRGRLTEVSNKYPEWKNVINRWSELESLYEHGERKKIDDILKETTPYNNPLSKHTDYCATCSYKETATKKDLIPVGYLGVVIILLTIIIILVMHIINGCPHPVFIR